jgi:hypothetical protein
MWVYEALRGRRAPPATPPRSLYQSRKKIWAGLLAPSVFFGFYFLIFLLRLHALVGPVPHVAQIHLKLESATVTARGKLPLPRAHPISFQLRVLGSNRSIRAFRAPMLLSLSISILAPLLVLLS